MFPFPLKPEESRRCYIPASKSFAKVTSERKLAAGLKETPYLSSPAHLSTKVGSPDRHLPGESAKNTRMEFSIIVPVLNEAKLIRPFLAHLRERAPEAEIIVADGGSCDGTADLERGPCDRIVVTQRNRAIQMNAGARAAHGDILWFVHVDAEVPWGCLDEIERITDDPKVAGGFFRIRLPRNSIYRMTDGFAHYAGIVLRMRCGDHGLFCRRTAFMDVGGFPEVPLMEDVEFFRRLQHRGRVTYSHKRILVSPRRYERVGRVRLTLAYGLIAMLYIFGVPLSKLASLYRRICCEAV